MRKALLLVACFLVLGGVYAGSAFYAAWEIREAMRTGDTDALARRVDWPSVRQSLKGSAVEARSMISELSASAGEPLPPSGIWQRIKSAVSPFVTDPLIDRYVTAEGAPRLWTMRQTWHQRVRPALLSEPTTPLSGTSLSGTSIDHALAVVVRLERVAFDSPTRMVLEIRDRFVQSRSWKAVLDLKGQNWVLTEVHILRKPTTAARLGPPYLTAA